MNRSLAHLMFGFVAISTCTHHALAEIVCETNYPNEQGHFVCKNTSPLGTTSVLFRNMNPWNGHSGVTIIDICAGDIPSAIEPKHGCLRRYCTQEGQALTMQFGPILLPITPIFGVFGFSFVHADFSILCNAIENARKP